MLALVAMEVTQQARECTKTETEADNVKSGVCSQDKPDNNGLCERSEKEREHSCPPELRCW